MEKEEKEKSKEKPKEDKQKKSLWSLQATSLLLLIVLIAIVLIVVQVPYTTTNAVKEIVPTETCAEVEIPFVANFRTGLKYETSSVIDSSDGLALYKYTDLGPSLFVNIRNIGEDAGVYCIDVQTYYIEDFEEGENALDSFLMLSDKESVSYQLLGEEESSPAAFEELNDALSTRYNYPICTENPIRPVQTSILSIWSTSILSDEAKADYDLNNLYLLVSVIAPSVEKCSVEDVEQEVEQEVTRYCNAWKHVVGKC